VVKPEVDSNKASVKDGIVPLKRYGRVPNKVRITHERVTARYPSLLLDFSLSAFLEERYRITAGIKVIIADQING
jgi:hypothetical protein